MDNRDLRTLKLLEEIDNDHTPSQRDLATKLNISLGLVNSFIRRLANKGYFKITSVPKNRVRYILTPKGAAEKARLTYEYIQYSYRFYKNVRNRLKTILKDIEKQGASTVAFYGAGDFAEIAYISLQETSLQLITVIDEKRAGGKFLGIPIKNLSSVDVNRLDKIIIAKALQTDDIISEMRTYNIDPEKIVLVDWK